MIIGYYNLLYICSIYNIWQMFGRVYGGVDYGLVLLRHI